MSATWCADKVCASVHAVWEVLLLTLPVGCLGIESCRQAKNNNLNKRKCCRNHFMQQVPLCLWFRPKKFFTVQSRLKIANNPNFDSTSNRRAAAIARMKTNLLKDNISIQFEGEPYEVVLLGTFKLLSIILSCLVCCMDGIDSFAGTFRVFFELVDDALASLHENQGVASLDLVFLHYLRQYASSSLHRRLSPGVAS